MPEQNAIKVPSQFENESGYDASHLRPAVGEPTAHPYCAIVIGRPLVNSSYLFLTGREPNALSRRHISQVWAEILVRRQEINFVKCQRQGQRSQNESQ